MRFRVLGYVFVGAVASRSVTLVLERCGPNGTSGTDAGADATGS